MKRRSERPSVRHILIAGLALLAPLAVAGAFPAEGQIVDHPDKLTFEDLEYKPPRAEDFRHRLKCGATAYVVENHEVPTFDLTVIVRTGSIYEPAEKAGLADMTGYLMRNGGIEGMTASELDERLAFLAGEIAVNIDASGGTASLFCLAKDIDEGLDLLKGVLRDPVFDQKAMERSRADVLSSLRQRNNDTRSIEEREWQFLVYGDHPSSKPFRSTERTIDSITREDMIEFHKKYFFPRNFLFAVSGDFKTKEILKKLDGMLAGWSGHELELTEIPDRLPDPVPGVYMIEKEGVNQSRVTIGHIGVKRDNPDEFAISIMNDILGGGGFTSRVVRRVRSDEGLAYSVGTTFTKPVLYPGTFRAWFQTKHSTAAFGARIVMDEIRRMREERVSEEEIGISKASFIGDLVNPFSTKKAIVNTFALDDYTGRPDNYWKDYEGNIRAVTADDVLRVARQYLDPEKMVFLVVGDPEAVKQGWDKDPASFSGFGEITILPLRDPLTLE